MYGSNPYLFEEALRRSARFQPHRDARALEMAMRWHDRAALFGTLSRI